MVRTGKRLADSQCGSLPGNNWAGQDDSGINFGIWVSFTNRSAISDARNSHINELFSELFSDATTKQSLSSKLKLCWFVIGKVIQDLLKRKTQRVLLTATASLALDSVPLTAYIRCPGS